MRNTVLVIDENRWAYDAIRNALSGSVEVRHVRTAAETEGLGVDVVVIAGSSPMQELSEMRVHPYLYDLPVVLMAPGHDLPRGDWLAKDVWPVTQENGRDTSVDEALVREVGRVLARAQHPSMVGRNASRVRLAS